MVAWGMRCIKSGLGLFHEFSKLQNRTVQFGNNPNQVHHTFRHVDDMGLNRNMVRSSVINDLKRISNIPVGKPVNRIINVSQVTNFNILYSKGWRMVNIFII